MFLFSFDDVKLYNYNNVFVIKMMFFKMICLFRPYLFCKNLFPPQPERALTKDILFISTD